MKPSLQIKYPSLLASLFSTSFVDKIIASDHLTYIQAIFQQTGFSKKVSADIKVSKALTTVFEYLTECYRCEYVYKTAILNEILIKRHDILEATYLTEFRAFTSKADIVVLNGTSTVYEIKSDIDKLTRLVSQVKAYQKIFDKVFVVSNAISLTKIKVIVPSGVGIIRLHPDLSIETIRESQSNICNVDKGLMFDSLRKPEYLSIISNAFGSIPNSPSTLIHSVCKRLFCEIPNDQAHSYFINVLKNRQISETQAQLISGVNAEIKGLLFEKKYSQKECEMIKFGLSQTITLKPLPICTSPTLEPSNLI